MKVRSLLLSFLIPLLVMGICVIAFEVQPFGDKSLIIIDGLHQYMPFFSVLYDKLREGGSIFHTFRAGLGINFLSLMAYYLMSPLNILICLFKRSQLNMAVSMILVLKIALSGLFMGIYLSVRTRQSSLFVVAGSVAYALNSYMVGYSWNVMWLDAIMVLPLIILGIDKLVEEDGGKLYCLALCFALLCNYYIGYMICIFCVIWFLLGHFKSFSQFVSKSLTFAVYSLLAGGMAAVILLPAYMGIRQTASGAEGEVPAHAWLTNLCDLMNRMIDLAGPITHDNEFDGNANLYIGIFILVLVVYYYLNRYIRLGDKIRRFLVIAFFFVSFSEKGLNYIWHGFHDQYGIPNRFSFLLGFLLIVMAAEEADKREGIRVWHAIPAAILGGFYLAACRIGGTDLLPDAEYVLVGILMLLYILILTLYAGSVFPGRAEEISDEAGGQIGENEESKIGEGAESRTGEDAEDKICEDAENKIVNGRARKTGDLARKILPAAFCVLAVIEISATGIKGFYEIGQINVPKFFRYTEDMEEAIRSVDDGTFYRSEVVKALMLDEAIYYPMNTVGLFGSTARGSMVTAMDKLGFSTGANEYKYVGENAFTNYLLHVRYQYYKDTDPVSTEFVYKDSYGHINVYENPVKTSAGYMVSRDIGEFFETGSVYPFSSMNKLAACGFDMLEMFTDIKIPEPMTSGCSVEPTGSPGEYRFHFEEKEDDNLVFNIPVTEGADTLYFYFDGTQVSSATVSVNGRDITTGDLDGNMICCGEAAPDSWLNVKMSLKGDEETGIVRLSAAGLDEEVFQKLVKEQEDYGFEATSYTDNTIEGTVTVNKAKTGHDLLFLSIPYDQGWTMKVDGKEKEAEKIGEAFLGTRLEDGTHHVELSYISPGFKEGRIITVVSVLIFILIIAGKVVFGILQKRPKKRSQHW